MDGEERNDTTDMVGRRRRALTFTGDMFPGTGHLLEPEVIRDMRTQLLHPGTHIATRVPFTLKKKQAVGALHPLPCHGNALFWSGDPSGTPYNPRGVTALSFTGPPRHKPASPPMTPIISAVKPSVLHGPISASLTAITRKYVRLTKVAVRLDKVTAEHI